MLFGNKGEGTDNVEGLTDRLGEAVGRCTTEHDGFLDSKLLDTVVDIAVESKRITLLFGKMIRLVGSFEDSRVVMFVIVENGQVLVRIQPGETQRAGSLARRRGCRTSRRGGGGRWR